MRKGSSTSNSLSNEDSECHGGRIFWSSARIRRLSTAVLLALIISLVVTALGDPLRKSLLKRGDFPAFYSAAMIASMGQGSRLYDAKFQRDLENHYWPSLGGEYYAFAYPPYVAACLKPLASLPPLWAKSVFTLLMLAALVASVYLMTALVPHLRNSFYPLFVFCLSFAPVSSGLIGGQNIALSMFLYAATLYSLEHWGKKGQFLAGVCLGLWCFKPHYGLIALLLVLIAGRLRIIAGALLPLCAYFLIAALFVGVDWPLSWISAVRFFAEEDFVANRHQMVSLIGFFKALAGLVPSYSAWGSLLYTLGICAAIGLLGLTGFRFFRMRGELNKSNSNTALVDALYLLGPAVILISPHTLYYDLGICILPLARSFKLDSDRRVSFVIFSSLAFFSLSLVKQGLAFQPMIIFAVFAYWLVYRDKGRKMSE